MSANHDRLLVTPTLVYWHPGCCWWPLEDGPTCPAEHDLPISEYRLRRGRKSRLWLCDTGDDRVAYCSRAEFLEHDEDNCYASYAS